MKGEKKNDLRSHYNLQGASAKEKEETHHGYQGNRFERHDDAPHNAV